MKGIKIMRNHITRTVTGTKVTIKDGITGVVKKEYVSDKKVDKTKAIISFVKETGEGNVFVEVTEVNETRAITIADFMKYSFVPTAEQLGKKEEVAVVEETK